MSSLPSFLIYTSAIQNEPGFILACSDGDLRWLANSFRKLAITGRFVLGDGHPIHSDHKCVIEVSANSDHGGQAELGPIRKGHFHWAIPLRQSDQYADMIDAMADSPEPCHQYLETAQPNVPVVLVSKGEFDVNTLRKMRDEAPGL